MRSKPKDAAPKPSVKVSVKPSVKGLKPVHPSSARVT
jgi:hypothetical protein